MADGPSDNKQSGGERGNKPALQLHVPEPHYRPGDEVDFSHVEVPEAGLQPRPDEACAARETEGLEIVLVVSPPNFCVMVSGPLWTARMGAVCFLWSQIEKM